MDELSLLNVFNRELSITLQDQNPINNFWFQTGAFTRNADVLRALNSGEDAVTIRNIGKLDASVEPNYPNTIVSDIAHPQTIGARKSAARVARMVRAVYFSDLENELTSGEPNRAVVAALNESWDETMELRAIASTFGVYNAMKTDKNKGNYIVSANTGFDVNAFIDAESLLPRNTYSGVIVVHSRVATAMRKQKLIDKVTDSANVKPVEFYNGRRVLVSNDRVDPISGKTYNWTQIGEGATAKYLTIVCDNNAFAADILPDYNDLEVSRTAFTGNGGGHTAIWSRRKSIIHPSGFSFEATRDQLTGGTINEHLYASLDDLANGNFWKISGNSNIRFLLTTAN